jgi:D-3-phosphoglycerate dehydrogenase
MKVLVATEKAFAQVAVKQIEDIITAAGYDMILLENYKSEDELLKAVADSDALIVRSDKITSAVTRAAKNLKIVVRAGAGYDNIDLEACNQGNIIAMNTPGQNANAVAELAFGMMLYNARGGFAGNQGTELRGKSLGLHAFGNVARYMASIASGFGMEVYAFDPFISSDRIRLAGAKPCNTIQELYVRCKYVSLHVPFDNKTAGSIGYDLVKLMPDNGVLVNTARKELIDEEGLIKLLSERPKFSYLTDVEPDKKDIFLSKFPDRCLFTSKKMGAQTAEANINAGVAAARQIVDFFKTGNQQFRVNK